MKKFYKNFDNYYDMKAEIDEFWRLGVDHRNEKGEVEKTVNKYHPERINYVVRDVTNETNGAKTIRLGGKNGYLPPFLAGQFVLFTIKTADSVATKAVYMASSPTERGYYDVLITKDGDPVADKLASVQIGDELQSSGPFGHFNYKPLFQGKKLVFVTSENTVAPVTSIVADEVAKKANVTIEIIDISADENSAIYHDHLTKLAENSNVNVTFVTPNTFTLKALQTMITIPEQYRYFLVGNKDNVSDWKKEISGLEIKDNHIKVEVPYITIKELASV
ncbi:FAD-binding oxidoreductase [Ligilactobacillus acidipiscis]|uniref:FAD-binding oxidoreductase n=1 Tax=Ligilactobacillus acidipiscis TaxID=89059 RepID=UPI0023F68A31|nr:FAD-binding oxidoreductase [Ligilactobacillus acidipiscis]WEV58189.1 FAD-binding oxidoreductase [Ligilactobacillus acidipiscis]